MAIGMLFLSLGIWEMICFLNSASQGSYGEERYLVRKWLPVILIGFCSSLVDSGDKTKLTELKGGLFLPTFFCGKSRLGA
jgi:hypothetical protein